MLGVLGILLAGCSGGDPAPGPGGADPDTGGGEQTRLAARLATLPESVLSEADQVIQVGVADLDRAAALAGISRPASSTDPAVIQQYVNALSGVSADGPPVSTLFPEVAQVQRVNQVAEFAAELGWSVADVSWFAEYQVPPHTFTAIGGPQESRLTDALGERSEDQIWRIGGEDYQTNLVEASAARPLGQALRLALAGDHLVMAQSTPPVAAALTGGPTLADHPTLSALVAAMDSEDAYSALLIAGTPGTFQRRPSTPSAQQDTQWLPRPFTGAAAGSAQVDGTPYGLFAYVHQTAADAEANAEALRRLLTEGASANTGVPWEERFEVADIRVDGTVVIARLTLGDSPPITPYTVLTQQDNLTSHD